MPRSKLFAFNMAARSVAALILLFALFASAVAQVTAWGANGSGQTNIPPGLTDVKKISAGYAHGLALRTNGTVVAWGWNGYGQCSVPAGLSQVVDIAAGFAHSVAVKADGTVVCWGDNRYGAISTPSGLTGVVAVEAADAHTLALKGDGKVVYWGYTLYGAQNIPPGLSDVVDIASSASDHCMALKRDGTVVCWGLNNFGQLNVPNGLSGVKAIATGSYHSIAVKSDGTVVCWGLNQAGQCNVPSGLTDVVAVAGGQYHSMALKADGTVVCWGHNEANQSIPPSDLSAVTAIAAGYYWSMALSRTSVVKVSTSAPSVTSGSTAEIVGTVTLKQALAVPTVVQLSSNDPGFADVPSSVTVAPWQTQASFAISTPLLISKARTVGITASTALPSSQVSTSFTLNPLTVTGVTLNPTSVTGGTPTTATITLNDPPYVNVVVGLASSNPSAASVADSVVVPATKSSVTVLITAHAVTATARANISASFGGVTCSAALTVKPLAIASLSMPSTAYGAQTVTGTVTLNGPAPTNLTVGLASDSPVVTVPASVPVAAGATSATFPVTIANTATAGTANVTATLNGAGKSRAIAYRPNALKTLSLSASSVAGNSTTVVTGSIAIAAAVSQPVTITLASSLPAALSVPSTVIIPVGQKSATFPVSHFWVAQDTPVTVTATGVSGSLTKNIAVQPNPVYSLKLSSSTVTGGAGATVTGTVRMKVDVGHDTVVTLSTSHPGIAGVPSTVTVPAGTNTVTFSITASAVNATTVVTIEASHLGVAKATLKVRP